jgi:hypothetical protein
MDRLYRKKRWKVYTFECDTNGRSRLSNENKLSGPGGLCLQLIKCGTGKLREMMRLCKICINVEYTPKEWRTSYLAPIQKKGSKMDPKSYKGKALLCTIIRIHSKALRTVTEKEIDTNQAKEQSSFTAGRSTINNVFTLKIATEKRIQRGTETQVVLINLAKEYDNVPVEILWKKMETTNINPILIEATINIYEKNTKRIRTGS